MGTTKHTELTMYRTVIGLLAIYVCASAANELFEGHFEAQLDRFRPQDPRNVNISYQANLEHYVHGAPFYIYIKDIFDESAQWIESGLMVDIAKNTSAALFTFTQRYFGSSRPTGSLSIDDLQYLTPDQNLYDLAQFIVFIRRQHQSPQAKIILWGSGYGGTTATWALKKFPHLIEAAWSSSGIYDVQIATFGVYDNLGYIIQREGGNACRSTIQNAFFELDAMVRAGESEPIRNLLNLCKPVQTGDMSDVGTLFASYYRYLIDYIERNHWVGIENICEALDVPDIGPLAALSRWVQYVYRNDHETCNDLSYDHLVLSAHNETWDGPRSVERRVAYLQCTQTGLFQITDDVSWLPNRVPLEYHQKICRDILGEQYKPEMLIQANAALLTSYGGLYQRISNVIYTNGDIDPWYFHGIVQAAQSNSFAFNIENFARSADLPSIRNQDPEPLNVIKRLIVEHILEWSAW